jgi:hypothetical protein
MPLLESPATSLSKTSLSRAVSRDNSPFSVCGTSPAGAVRASARSMAAVRSGNEKAFQATAPAFIALTASATSPNPVIMMTGRFAPACASSPRMTGIRTSTMAQLRGRRFQRRPEKFLDGFNGSDHPRASDGIFGAGGGGKSSAAKPANGTAVAIETAESFFASSPSYRRLTIPQAQNKTKLPHRQSPRSDRQVGEADLRPLGREIFECPEV